LLLRVLARKPKGKRETGKPRRRWEDIITINLQEIVWEDMKLNDRMNMMVTEKFVKNN
jgi:hypothetical protein